MKCRYLKKKRGPERGPEGGPKRGTKGQKGVPEGRVNVLSTPVINKYDYLWKVFAELNIPLSIELDIPLSPTLAKKQAIEDNEMKYSWTMNKVGMFKLF